MRDFEVEWQYIRWVLQGQMDQVNSGQADGGPLSREKYQERIGRMINQLDQLLEAHNAATDQV